MNSTLIPALTSVLIRAENKLPASFITIRKDCWSVISALIPSSLSRIDTSEASLSSVIKLAAIIVGLFIAALAYLQYQRILNVDWERVQAFSQNGITWVMNVLTHISSNIDASHSGMLPNIGIPLVSSVSAGFVLGLARG